MISHRHQCLFVHIPKCAGQSVERLFLELHGLTWKTREPLLLRYNSDPTQGPPRLAHLKASEYVKCGHVTSDQYQNYFKFAFVRNPWDRLVSLRKHLGFAHSVDFKTFAMKIFPNEIWKEMHWFVGPQSDFLYGPDGELLVDFVGRFEKLAEDFHQVCLQSGLPPKPLPRSNQARSLRRMLSRFRQVGPHMLHHPLQTARSFWNVTRPQPASQPSHGVPHYEQYFDKESQEFIASLYQADIAHFGYRFGVADECQNPPQTKNAAA